MLRVIGGPTIYFILEVRYKLHLKLCNKFFKTNKIIILAANYKLN